MSEIYVVIAEYLDKARCSVMTATCGWSPYYDFAKKRCHAIVEEDIQEGTIPDASIGKWNGEYEDIYEYEDDDKRVCIYVEAVDAIELKQN